MQKKLCILLILTGLFHPSPYMHIIRGRGSVFDIISEPCLAPFDNFGLSEHIAKAKDRHFVD